MNRTSRDSGSGVRSSTHRRGHSNGAPPSDDNTHHLDLFSRNRRSLSVAPSDDSSDASLSIKLGRLSTKPKNVLDDLLSSTDGGKHDYDWLLTPPGTPMFPTSDANHGSEPPNPPATTRSSSLARSISTSTATKASRLSVSQSSETNNRPRPARSSSVTRPSVSTSQYSSYSNKNSNILNTSSASVSSYIRPSTPTRSSSISRPSTPSSRPVSSRSSTPSRGRPSPSAASSEKVRPSQNSRPSTPTSRPQVSATSNMPAARSASRPSTPTRRNSAPPSSIPVSGPSNHSAGRSLQNGRAASSTSRPSSPSPRPVASTSRPSSPSPRVRPTPQPIVLPDFSLETPPNLRTTLPDRPLSAGRSRPPASVGLKGNVENQSAPVSQRRQSSPIVSRGRLAEPPARNRVTANGHADSYRAPHGAELSSRKPLKTSTDSTGFGRNISKKSLDMAIRHMDIRNGSNGVRPLSGSTLFPQSIRSSNGKGQQHQNPPLSGVETAYNGDGPMNHHNGGSAENGNLMNRYLQSGNEEVSAKLTMGDIYESSRYDTFLRKEDLKNTNWLHSLDDISDQGSMFDNGFEPLPEPFDPL